MGNSLDRIKAYSVLAEELGRFRSLPREELAHLIGGPIIEKTVEHESGPFVVEIRVEWAQTQGGAVRVRATANGPSWWRLERMEESIVVSPILDPR